MPYKISGELSDNARIIVIKEDDWSIESNTNESSGSYEVDSLDSGKKLVIARQSDGEIVAYGDVSPEDYVPSAGNTGVFGGGNTGSASNVMDYITISTTGNATDFGDLAVVMRSLAGTSNGSLARGIFGGNEETPKDTINYITITSPADATDFGNLTAGRHGVGANSNGTNDRGVFCGGDWPTQVNILDYITISSAGNATDFGDMAHTNTYFNAGCSNGTNERGIFAGGGYYTGSAYNTFNAIDYITISSTGNSTDFGDMTESKRNVSAASSGTSDRGVIFAGKDSSKTNVIEYITISSTGNATDFGDLTAAIDVAAATSNGTNGRAVCGGGANGGITNTINYITIATTGNAQDFGDLTVGRLGLGACANA